MNFNGVIFDLDLRMQDYESDATECMFGAREAKSDMNHWKQELEGLIKQFNVVIKRYKEAESRYNGNITLWRIYKDKIAEMDRAKKLLKDASD